MIIVTMSTNILIRRFNITDVIETSSHIDLLILNNIDSMNI